MSEEVEDRSSRELSDLEGKKEQFSTFEESKIKYTKAFLLEFGEVKFCSKLPRDFDLLILRELGDASDDKIESRRMPYNPSLCAPLPPTRWNVGLLENGGAITQCLPGESGYNAGILGSRSQKNELFQLKKSENPYRPPHCHKVDNAKYEVTPSMKETDLLENKASWQDKSWLEQHMISSVGKCESKNAYIDVLDENDFVTQGNEVKGSDADLVMDSSNFEDTYYKYSRTSSDNLFSSDLHANYDGLSNVIKMMPQLLDACSEHGMGFSVNSSFSVTETDQEDLVDSTTGNDNFEYGFPFPDVDDFLNSILGDCEASWRNNGRSKMVAVTDRVERGMIKDNECTSDDDWAEISQILQLERVYDDLPDSEIESCLPDENSLILVSQSTISTQLNFGASDNCDHVTHSDTEISWPDEDSLISVDNLISPQSSMSSLNRNSKEADKLTSNLTINVTKNLEALNVTKLDNESVSSATHGPKVQPFLDVSGLVTRGKLHTSQSQSQTSHVIFSQNRPSLYPGNDQLNFPAKYKTPNITCYVPSVNCYTCSNSHHRAFQGTTVTNLKANDSLVHYSLLQQPHVRPQQQNQKLIDSACANTKQVAASDLNTMQFFPWTSQQMIYQGFGKSNAVFPLDPGVIGDLGDQNASGILNADMLLYCGCPFSRSKTGPGTLTSQ